MNPDVGYLSDVWRLTISTSGSASWQQLAVSDSSEAPVARDKHVLARVGGEVVMFGGFGLVDEEEEQPSSSDASSHSSDESESSSDASDCEDEPAATFKWFDDLWHLSIDVASGACSWQRVTPANGPSCRAAPASAVHDGVLYLFGGRLANGSATPRDNSLWQLNYQIDNSKWHWQQVHGGDKDSCSTACPPGRSAASAACLEDGTFVVAGGIGNDNNALADIWAFAHGRWHAVSSSTFSAPTARSAASCVALSSNTLLFAFGSSGLDVTTGISATYVRARNPTVVTAAHRV